MLGRLSRSGGTIVVAAVVGALAAGTPSIASTVVDFAKRAGNADKVNGLSASKTPRAGMLVPLNARGDFPASVLPPGAHGATGATGAKGDTGATGATGAMGATGATGAAGAKGATGANGTNGAAGAAGAQGLKGDTGDTGAAGAAGAKGDKGDTGATGADGAPGATGAKGDKGDTGANGTDGAAGAAGTQGIPGLKGDKGDTGDAGPKGDKGDKGDPGADGSVYFAPLVDINPMPMPSRSAGWGKIFVNHDAINNGYRSTCCVDPSGNYIEWDIPLGAGDWKLQAIYTTFSDAGVLNFSVDGAAVGDVNTYDASGEFNQTSVFDVHVATAGTHTLRVSSTLDASSGGQYGYLSWLRFVKQ